MKKYEGKSLRNVKTDTGKIPSGVGFSGGGGGFICPVVTKASALIAEFGLRVSSAVNRVVDAYAEGTLDEGQAIGILSSKDNRFAY